ncbi:MAG: 30S ribosomal protein S17 [Candidatus Sungbacteria bacterium]|nr:30S ribosomal protein S17 [Candidatus Sungbacteria bacterium]
MRRLKGTVVSNKMAKTVVVRVDRLKKQPKYQKYYRVSAKFKAHDEKGEYKVDDIVMIQETRPLSRDKKWKVTELVKRREKTVENE